MNDTIPRQEIEGKIKSREFTDVAPCELCGGEHFQEEFYTKDKCRIVSCTNCDLWFTSPRLDEGLWNHYLRDPGNQVTNDIANRRRKHGVAHAKNIPENQSADWRKSVTKLNDGILDEIESIIGGKIKTLHDVGCGVGFLLEDARERGIEVSGNELNEPAFSIMRSEVGLNVINCNIEECNLTPESLDAVTMGDVIEHVYHPMSSLVEAYKALKVGGVLYVNTFRIDCPIFEELREGWNFLYWNHVTHFSTETLGAMIRKAGFCDVREAPTNRDHIVTFFAIK